MINSIKKPMKNGLKRSLNVLKKSQLDYLTVMGALITVLMFQIYHQNIMD